MQRKKLLFTGAGGFVGRNAVPILRKNYEVFTLGRGDGNDFSADLSAGTPCFGAARFDVVFHAAGKAHSVPRTADEARRFFDVNLAGTRNLCRALDAAGTPRAFVFASTVAVYGREFGEDISEDHPLGGKTPYAESKIAAEEFLREWCAERDVVLTILRPSLIAGADAPGNLGAMVRGLRSGRYLRVGRGNARKSVVMVEDLARVVPLAENRGGVFNLCASYAPTLAELENLICAQLGKRPPRAIPFFAAKCLALAGDCLFGKAPIDSARLRKITGTLTFSSEKARRELNWRPLEILENYRISAPNPPLPIGGGVELRADFRKNALAFPRVGFFGKEAAQ